MSPRRLRRLAAAPDLLVVELVDKALARLLRAMALEHPARRQGPVYDDPIRQRAIELVEPTRRLRRDLASYKRIVLAVVDDLHRDDLPF